ncbi:MAG: amino acid racemase [Oenococcus sp.]|uniref:aspartate/glutamate racemase family protein n=1 Tax=Oenococcus TaxID=46254 RepID=UPI0021E78E36|nr:amino acid racemase [Oenococcus kitaharae]MCV3296390.1 amino acid racemase [Oenococcus kitaharae]
MKNFFGILGGMGTRATEAFIDSINQLARAQNDQDYLNYIVFNHAAIPDRTAYILGRSDQNPLPFLIEDVQQMNQLSPDFILITCNTAHNFLPQLQKAAHMPILDMPSLAAAACKQFSSKNLRVGLLATSGTIEAAIYQPHIAALGYQTILPDPVWQRKVMDVIYKDVKEADQVNRVRFHALIEHMLIDEKCDCVILACTELSVAQQREAYESDRVIDAQQLLARRAVQLARSLQFS